MTSSNEQEAFLAFITRHKGIIYKVANLYCKHAEDRKDLVQEIIFQLWKSFARYNQQYKLSTWMYRIALNVAISFYRKEKRRRVMDMPSTDGIIEIADESDANAVDANLQLLQQFIHALKDLDKALILLYLEETSYKEIAEIVGITETNVASKISRIKERLKQKFKTINR